MFVPAWLIVLGGLALLVSILPRPWRARYHRAMRRLAARIGRLGE